MTFYCIFGTPCPSFQLHLCQLLTSNLPKVDFVSLISDATTTGNLEEIIKNVYYFDVRVPIMIKISLRGKLFFIFFPFLASYEGI